MGSAVLDLMGSPVNGTGEVPGILFHRPRRKHIGFADVLTEDFRSNDRKEAQGTFLQTVIPKQLAFPIGRFRQLFPVSVIGHGGNPQPPFIQLLTVGIPVIVGKANHPAARVHFRLRALIVELLTVVEKDNGFVPPQILGLAIEHTDGFDKTKSPDIIRCYLRGAVGTHPQGFHHSGGGNDVPGGDGGAVIQFEGSGFAGFRNNSANPAFHPPLSSEFTEALEECPDDDAHPLQGTPEAFLEERFPHDDKLVPIDVIFTGAAVVKYRAEKHLREERFPQDRGHPLAGGLRRGVEVEFVVLQNCPAESPEVIDVGGKRLFHFRFEHREIVGEAEIDVWKGDPAAHLGSKVEIFPTQAQLPQKLAQRCSFDARFDIIGDGVQADIKAPSVKRIKTVQPAGRIVPLDDEDGAVIHGEADTGGEAGHAAADDDYVKMLGVFVHCGPVGRDPATCLRVDGVELRREVFRTAVEGGELRVILLRDFDPVLLAKLHDDIEEIHGVEVKLVAQAHIRLYVGQIFVGCDLSDDVENDLLALFLGHIQRS